MHIARQIAQEIGCPAARVEAVLALLEEGATIPFIARYRKEAHGGLDEVVISGIAERQEQLKALEDRKQAIIASLEERGIATESLLKGIAEADTLSRLEDLYLPYRPKRRTRASIARERGLEPLATLLLEQRQGMQPLQAAAAYVSTDKGVADVASALAGAQDIIAEMVAEDATLRGSMRMLFMQKGVISARVVKGKEADGVKYQDYYDWQEPIAKVAGHRLLAMLRGENEGMLAVKIRPDQESALQCMRRQFLKNSSPAATLVAAALDDSYSRLLAPAMETETRNTYREKAEDQAIGVFAQNVRELLLAPPLGQKRLLAVDPGFRTGCKIVCLDAQGTLLHHDIIFIMTPAQQSEAAQKVERLCQTYSPEAIAVGNGTAGRETEQLLRSLGLPVPVVMVSEQGASVYSASETARREFPDLDLTVRGAISIGRRLMDPLAELVKIDPKSIGVGQYQHDVDQGKLKKSLEHVVVSCVNAVGVEVNTASVELLTYVSGLGPSLAKYIVAYREANGPFTRRKDLLAVPRLGPKAFEQAAGFLRITGGTDPLDASAVHPEAYAVVKAMAASVASSVQGLMEAPSLRAKLVPENFVSGAFGLPTVKDILQELEKPGRDPRSAYEAFTFSDQVASLDDLQEGMRLPGIITNVTHFGAFVDIGVHQDGLVHISQLADRFIEDPHQVVKVQQQVMVTVLQVDRARNRISLSLKE